MYAAGFGGGARVGGGVVGGGAGFAVAPPAAGGGLDLGCAGGDGGNLCFEPTGAEVSENWAYRGEGRGAYAQVSNIQYVGNNQGAYDREQVVTITGWRCRAYCYILMCLIFVGIIGFLVWFFTQTGPVQAATTEREFQMTTQIPFDCQAGFWNWQKGWSEPKKTWCCEHQRRGCAPVTTSEPYDCDAALNNWRAAWSESKKSWCCNHYTKGCPPTTTDSPYHCHLGHVRYWSLEKKAYCCDHYSLGCAPDTTSAPYDCKAGARNWEQGWSDGKKTWCCQRFNLGCPTTEPYDCTSNLANWELAWSLRQQTYCCRQHQRGCTTTTSLPYDCDAGYSNWEAGWSSSKKVWCCQHANKACVTTTTLPYDCSANLVNWHEAWSNLKKAWCCKHVQRGCETTTSKSSLPYDCDAGFSNWQAGWSGSKQEWCCKAMSRGCPITTTSAPYDCAAGYSNWEQGWSASKKHWCCAYHNKACDAFDCSEGFASWQTAWTDVKRAWCCEKHSKGCTTMMTTTPAPIKKSCVLWGDPHVKTFDGSRSVFYSEGDFWIVKSAALKVQGRFQATDWTKKNDETDYSSMTGIIVSGTLMQGHKIQVDSMLGSITCSGRQILQKFGQTSCGTGTLTFDSQGELVDSAMAFLPHKVVHIKLPRGVFVQVNRWPNFINAKITMTKQFGQDGVCGNFNGVEKDDVGQALHKRFGHGVSSGEDMFSNPIPWHSPQKMPSSRRCSPAKMTQAKNICRLAAKQEGWSFAECLGDVCDEHTPNPSIQAQEMQHLAQKALR